MATHLKLFFIALTCFRLNAALSNTRYYPRYHLAPYKNWMNDPNGFCVFNGSYHLFYQCNPENSTIPGTARWCHVKSKDMFHWQYIGIALDHDQTYDKNGVFSGSAVVDSGVMYVYYTGHVKLTNQTLTQNETQELATSTDGVNFTKYAKNPVIVGKGLQPNLRDPKVWKHGSSWYMVLGNSFNESDVQFGRVLLYKSTDKTNWTQVTVLGQSDGFLGYMWECPDFFELDGYFVLLFSPQGVQAEGDNYKNLYQTGYIVGSFNYTDHIFTPITEFRELDHGHDFYATQSCLDDNGRRLVVAWMDMWLTSYPTTSAEALDGFTGQMTLIRQLSLSEDYQLLQKPVKEVYSIRGETLHEGSSVGGTTVTLSNKTAEVYVVAPHTKNFTMYIGSNTTYVTIQYDYTSGHVSLRRDSTDDGLRRTTYSPSSNLTMSVFIDASSIEVFLGEGEVTFSSRYFIDHSISVRLGTNSTAEVFEVYEMKSTLYNS